MKFALNLDYTELNMLFFLNILMNTTKCIFILGKLDGTDPDNDTNKSNQIFEK